MNLSFFVPGKPQTAGSKRAFVLKKAGQYTGRAIVTDDNPKSRDWKIDIQHAARDATREWEGNRLGGAISLTLTFFLIRPKGHYGSGKNAATVKPDAPAYPIVKPDVLKLARAVEDALTSIVWDDDAQIVAEYLFKRYGDQQGVRIFVQPHTD